MTTETKECAHYWLIEEPHGPSSKGKCKFCGEEKEFWNSNQGSAIDYITQSESKKIRKKRREEELSYSERHP